MSLRTPLFFESYSDEDNFNLDLIADQPNSFIQTPLDYSGEFYKSSTFFLNTNTETPSSDTPTKSNKRKREDSDDSSTSYADKKQRTTQEKLASENKTLNKKITELNKKIDQLSSENRQYVSTLSRQQNMIETLTRLQKREESEKEKSTALQISSLQTQLNEKEKALLQSQQQAGKMLSSPTANRSLEMKPYAAESKINKLTKTIDELKHHIAKLENHNAFLSTMSNTDPQQRRYLLVPQYASSRFFTNTTPFQANVTSYTDAMSNNMDDKPLNSFQS